MELKLIPKLFTNPEIIVDYAKNKWSFGKFSLIILIGGFAFGFNFFWSNFIIPFQPGNYIFFIVFPLLGAFVFDMAVYSIIGLLWLSLKIYLKFVGNRSEASSEIMKNSEKEITLDNYWDWIKVFSYCYLLPYAIYSIVLLGVNILLISMGLYYIMVYIRDFSKFFTYIWIITLMIYSTRNLKKEQKYKIQFILLTCFALLYLVGTIAYFNIELYIGTALF
jgi:hypothetical protein